MLHLLNRRLNARSTLIREVVLGATVNQLCSKGRGVTSTAADIVQSDESPYSCGMPDLLSIRACTRR